MWVALTSDLQVRPSIIEQRPITFPDFIGKTSARMAKEPTLQAQASHLFMHLGLRTHSDRHIWKRKNGGRYRD